MSQSSSQTEIGSLNSKGSLGKDTTSPVSRVMVKGLGEGPGEFWVLTLGPLLLLSVTPFGAYKALQSSSSEPWLGA